MKLKTETRFRLGAIALAAMLAGCSALDAREETLQITQDLKTAPEHKPHRAITGFSTALSCMDGMMIDYGVRDVSVMVEDVIDQTKKVNAGAKDMLISAVSDMTARSRAVSLSVYGSDVLSARLRAWEGGRRPVNTELPQFDIKGSISQLDDSIARKQTDAGAQISSYLGFGVANMASTAVLGLDLTMLRTDNLSVVPGVTSRNAVVLVRSGNGMDVDATIKKFGVNYSMSVSRNEGQAQGLRNLVELASIELFGKLTRTPYWKCLGGGSGNPEVDAEVSNWYYTLASQSGGLHAWFQYQLRQRGHYSGPIDGQDGPALQQAVVSYRKALGLSAEPLIDQPFFAAYLQADHRKIAAANPPRPAGNRTPVATTPGASPATPTASQATPQPAAVTPTTKPEPIMVAARDDARGLMDRQKAETPAKVSTAAEPAGLSLALGGQLAPGKPYTLNLVSSQDAYVYCYMQDGDGRIQRFFPNRFNRDGFVKAGSALNLPGSMPFELVADASRKAEKLACYGSRQDVLSKVPPPIAGTNFQPIKADSLDRVREAFARAADGQLAQGVIDVQAR